MKTLRVLTASATILLGAMGLAVAQTDHGHGAQDSEAAGSSNNASGPMVSDQTEMMAAMMPMMKYMHAQMMGGSSMMMDRGMMQMMMGPGMMGMPSTEDATAAMQSRLTEFDADGDGNLSLSEFEALHSAMIRETTVDRFQHLDADGDGAVSPSEMIAPVGRMNMRAGMDGMPMDDINN